MAEKSKRIEDRELLDRFRDELNCAACGTTPVDPCHIKSVGSGGHDHVWNLIALCRTHHTEQHKIGWYKMAKKYPIVETVLDAKGWIFDPYNRIRRRYDTNWHFKLGEAPSKGP